MTSLKQHLIKQPCSFKSVILIKNFALQSYQNLHFFNQLSPNASFLHHLKRSENYDIFRG